MQWLSSIINASIVTYQHDREISNLEFTQQKITYQGDGTYLFEGYSNEKSFKIYYKNNNITCIDDIMYYNTNSNEVMPAVPQI